MPITDTAIFLNYLDVLKHPDILPSALLNALGTVFEIPRKAGETPEKYKSRLHAELSSRYDIREFQWCAHQFRCDLGVSTLISFLLLGLLLAVEGHKRTGRFSLSLGSRKGITPREFYSALSLCLVAIVSINGVTVTVVRLVRKILRNATQRRLDAKLPRLKEQWEEANEEIRKEALQSDEVKELKKSQMENRKNNGYDDWDDSEAENEALQIYYGRYPNKSKPVEWQLFESSGLDIPIKTRISDAIAAQQRVQLREEQSARRDFIQFFRTLLSRAKTLKTQYSRFGLTMRAKLHEFRNRRKSRAPVDGFEADEPIGPALDWPGEHSRLPSGSRHFMDLSPASNRSARPISTSRNNMNL